MEFGMTTRIALPDSADLLAQPSSVVTLFSQLRSTVTISSNELALVSIEASQMKLARKPQGAQVVARKIMVKEFGWNMHQYACLQKLWNRESHWNYRAHNRRSGAHGIAQALPAGKMAVISTDWRTNPVTQIRWGLHYIDIRYSTPCNALSRFYRHNSY
jgi:pyruvate dehydrogenase complex dehydrogenase (E1) component